MLKNYCAITINQYIILNFKWFKSRLNRKKNLLNNRFNYKKMRLI